MTRYALALALVPLAALAVLGGPAAGSSAPAGAPAREGREVRAAAARGETVTAFPSPRARVVPAFPGHQAPAEPAVAPAPAPARTRGGVIKEILPSNVRIAAFAGEKQIRSASGVVVAVRQEPEGPVGWVLTNQHVVEGKRGQRVRFEVLVDRKRETTTFDAEVVANGEVPDLDIAVLRVPGLDVPAAVLAGDDDLELGDEVVAIGAPFGRGLSISSGIVSQLEYEREEDEGPLKFKTDAPIGYGASGGGIFRIPDGKLLALVEGYRTAKVSFPVKESSYSFDVPMPGETFAAPVAKIRRFLRANGLAHLLAGEAAATAEVDR